MTGEAPRPQPKPAKRKPKPRKPLVRTRMKRRPPRRLKGAGSDKPFLAWLHSLACVVFWSGGSVRWDGCDQRIHAHHAKHLSQGGTDRDAVPLCEKHHRQWHAASGVFRLLSKQERTEWAEQAIAATQAAWSRA